MYAVADVQASGYRSTGKECDNASETVKANDTQDDR